MNYAELAARLRERSTNAVIGKDGRLLMIEAAAAIEELARDAGRYRKLRSFALPRYVVLAKSGETPSTYYEKEVTVVAASWEELDAAIDAAQAKEG